MRYLKALVPKLWHACRLRRSTLSAAAMDPPIAPPISSTILSFGTTDGPFATAAAEPQCEQLGPKIWKLSNVLTSEESAMLIDAAERIGFEDADAYCFRYRTRLNDRLVSDDVPLAQMLSERCLPLLPSTVSSAAWGSRTRDGPAATWRVDVLNPRFRLCRYIGGRGHYFGPHIDGSYQPGDERRSCLTFMLYLNPQGSDSGGGGAAAGTRTSSLPVNPQGTRTSSLPTCGGGATNFFKQADYEYGRVGGLVAHTIVPEVGVGVVFYQSDNDGDLLHEGAPVTSGVKYILRTDIMCDLIDPDADSKVT